jgi:hypothetical protein
MSPDGRGHYERQMIQTKQPDANDSLRGWNSLFHKSLLRFDKARTGSAVLSPIHSETLALLALPPIILHAFDL